MSKDRLPVVAEIRFCFYLYGPFAFDGYEYTALIKIDPDQELSSNRIGELIEGMGYAWKIHDITTYTMSSD